MTALVLAVLIVMAMLMTAAWFTVRATDDGGWTDVFWTFGTGATCTLAALAPMPGAATPDWRQAMVALLVAVWAGRLGFYIARRVARGPEDARYSALKGEWGAKFIPTMFALLIVQAPITALLSISVLLAARTPGAGVRPADVIGALVLVAAIVGETIADGQMKRFKADPANKGEVCDAGLWAWSRHPNYLFEALGWIAYPVIAIDPARPWTFAAFLAPVIMFLLLRYGTGLPPLETAMVASKGDAYRRYQARVSPFLLRPPARPSKESAA